jgi:hypothetical protein
MTKPTITTQELQRRIGHRAKSAPTHRFWGLYVHLVKAETLEAAYLEAKRDRGSRARRSRRQSPYAYR